MPFPITEPTATNIIKLYGEFSDTELSTIVQSNRDVEDPRDPLGHLLSLQEQPYLQLFESAAVGEQTLAAYRTAVCLGATMVRRYARDQHIDLSEIQANPRRRYLPFADQPVDEAIRRYGAWPIMTEDFTDAQYYQQYFRDHASAERVKQLQKDLIKNHIGFMENEDTKRRAETFGFFCRGLLDTFELYRQLRHESKVAPTEVTLDPEQHHVLDATPSWATPAPIEFEPNMRWRVGGIATARVLPGEDKVHFETQVGNTIVRPESLVIRVSRGIGGFVSRQQPDDRSLPVLFKRSQEVFSVDEQDTLIVRSSDGDRGVFSALAYPFLLKADLLHPQTEVVAICQNGQVKFLYDPVINLDTEESTLAAALQVASPQAQDV